MKLLIKNKHKLDETEETNQNTSKYMEVPRFSVWELKILFMGFSNPVNLLSHLLILVNKCLHVFYKNVIKCY